MKIKESASMNSSFDSVPASPAMAPIATPAAAPFAAPLTAAPVGPD